MKEHDRRPQNNSDIHPLDTEMYYAIEQPILTELLQMTQDSDMHGSFAMQYPRTSSIDGSWERVGILIVDDTTNRSEPAVSSYRITVMHYKDEHFKAGENVHAMNEKDSTAYTIVETTKGLRAYVDVMYADCAYIAQHEMNAVEHSMLVDELVRAHQWQFADQYEEA